jgi:putative restriction endonuclease
MAETINWQYLAGKVWPVLTAAAKARKTVTYKQIGDDVIHRHHRAVRHALGPIQDFCMAMQLPPLTALVVNQGTQLPGMGFIAHDVDDIETAFDEVSGYDWTNVPNPYGSFGPDDSEETFAAELVGNPTTAKEIYGRVKVRGVVQSIFRRALMKAYDTSCAFCGLQFPEALEAAHIKPWARCNRQERLDPRNGLLLCSTHHRLFDAHWLLVTPERTIRYYTATEGWTYSDADKLVSALHGTMLRLPAREALWPSVDHINARATA